MSAKIMKRVHKRKKPPIKKPTTHSDLQKKCLYIMGCIESHEIDTALQESLKLMSLRPNFDTNMLVDNLLKLADFQVITYHGGLSSDLIPVSASYKNYKGYKLPWMESETDKPVARFAHRNLWVAVLYCFIKLCLRTDTKLWETATKKPPSQSRRKLRRIAKAGTRN